MACVYKLTREDGLEYIGITTNLPKRLKFHNKSHRFSELAICNVEILFEGNYDECDALEEEFIIKYDTFKNGLNLTNRGKGKNLSDKFNTFGYKFSEDSKLKMSISAKAREERPTGYRHSVETKQHWSELRKGKVWGPSKIDPNILADEWKDFTPIMKDMEHLISIRPDGIFFKNGRPFTYTRGKLVLFKRLKSKEYGVTPEAIKRIITNERLL